MRKKERQLILELSPASYMDTMSVCCSVLQRVAVCCKITNVTCGSCKKTRTVSVNPIHFCLILKNIYVWPLGKYITKKSRNSRKASGGKGGAEGMVTKGANLRSQGTKYKRSKITFALTSID